ncbi:MAG: endonuclease III domain-containing protein [Dehalococcoidia bacterium]
MSKGARGSPPRPGRIAAPPVGLTAPEVLALLEPLYGPFRRPRSDPVSELVFTILSQHTSDVNAQRALQRLRERYGSWEAVAQADPEGIAECIYLGGLSRVKAPRLKAVLNRIQELRGSLELDSLRELPLEEAKAWLRSLPGVGPKTAAVVLSFALGMPAMPVDTHVHRVARRLGLIGPKTSAEEAHQVLEAMVAPEQVLPFHVYFITHGRQVCKAQRPLCRQCVLARGCPSRPLFEAGVAGGKAPSRSTPLERKG